MSKKGFDSFEHGGYEYLYSESQNLLLRLNQAYLTWEEIEDGYTKDLILEEQGYNYNEEEEYY